MSGLADTVSFLKRLPKSHAPDRRASPRDSLCRTVQGFGPNPGALAMRLYLPSGLPKGAPLVVVLHGCTQEAEPHAASGGWLQLADRLGFAVLLPEQGTANNPNRCFNWFQPQDAVRGKGEAASIAQMIGHAVKTHGLDHQRVYVTGLSAGGAMAAVMLAAYPELFAGGAIVAGLPYGVARNVQEALALMQNGASPPPEALAALVRKAAPRSSRPLRVAIWHGEADGVVCPANGRASAQQWVAALGLPDQPVITQDGRCERHVWTNSDSSVELITVRGMGHCTPLATQGEAGLGFSSPFMQEVGVSSTLEIAAFWGLERSPDYSPVLSAPPTSKLEDAASAEPAHEDGLADQVLAATAAHVSPQVQGVIEKALKAAGLKR